ncbi:MAG: rod shape-determining protein RodA [Syntrophales bacterium]|nr:rod shape-determining protein RodA [Syntrophales bacterium]
MNLVRRFFSHFDFVLFLLVMTICLVGVLNIYSAGFNISDVKGSNNYVRQLQWVLLGVFGMILTYSIDYRTINSWAYGIYGFAIFLLILTSLFGYTTHGAKRWIYFSGFTFQPSELVKLALVLALVRYFHDHPTENVYSWRELVIPFLMTAVPSYIILKQPDLGSALMLIIIFFSLVIFVGVRVKDFVLIMFLLISISPLFWFFLKEYQRGRILAFLNPERDPLGTGYHLIQSMIAVGSGGFFGKGFLKGTQTQLKFLPEQQTDFIFSVFAEEWGFLGSVLLLFLFLILILWGLRISMHSRDYSGSVLAFGVTVLIFWGIVINVSMVLGLLPVVGVPLPFLSYGGSAMLVNMLGVGILLNVSGHRFRLQP